MYDRFGEQGLKQSGGPGGGGPGGGGFHFQVCFVRWGCDSSGRLRAALSWHQELVTGNPRAAVMCSHSAT